MSRKRKNLCRISTGSRSYRIGRAITYIPRKTRGGILCLKENGLKYTVKHTAEKLRRRMR